jgi:hypothetical protein
MRQNRPDSPPWPSVFRSSAASSKRVRAAVEAGELRAIGLRLYTSDLHSPLDEIVRRNRWRIVGLLAPGAVIGYRTALEARPAPDGTVFLTGASRYERDLPGLQIRVAKGVGSLPGDRPFLDGLQMASIPRALLEALGPGRQRGTATRRTLTDAEAEAWLERTLLSGGEAALGHLRDEARALAPTLGAEAAFERLQRVAGMLLGSRPGTPTAPTAVARLAGRPYDEDRDVLFQALFARLRERPFAPLPKFPPPPAGPVAAFSTVAFFDAYFSNFIEGTEFEVEQAREIVFEGVIPTTRPEDAHDVLGTYALVGDATWMTRGLTEDRDFPEFRDRLRAAHARLLRARPDVRPGQFKEVANRAGDTRFVEPHLVEGTLQRGFEVVRALETPFQRAAALMFVISEVHPFDDGNGRVARAFMNAELVAGHQPRILIPSVYRDDYLTGLRVLSRQQAPDPFLEVLQFAQRVGAAIDWTSYATAEPALRATNAFARPGPDCKLRFPIPLVLP